MVRNENEQLAVKILILCVGSGVPTKSSWSVGVRWCIIRVNGGAELEQTLLTLVSIITTIMLAAIPWAYVVHGRLTHIESCLQGIDVTEIFKKLASHDLRLMKLELKLLNEADLNRETKARDQPSD